MRKKLFRYFLLLVLPAVLLSCACLLTVMAGQTTQQAFAQLEAEAELAQQAWAEGGEARLTAWPTTLRLTLVAPDGGVLLDNQAEAAAMENHLDRPEIARALAEGSARTTHRSQTLMTQTLYYARRLPDGSVLRLACTQASALSVLLGSLPALAAVLPLLLLLCVALSARLADQLVRPIDQMDMDRPGAEPVYPELAPLVTRIGQQRRTIRAQEEEQARSRQAFAALTENMSEGFLLLSPELEVLTGNRTAQRLLGLPELGKAPVPLANLCREPFVLQAAQTALVGQRGEALLPLGGRTWQLIASPMTTEGRLTGAVLLLLDVTERAAREQLRREFSANVSHELKTPLTVISGYAELMEEGLLPPEKTGEAAGTIRRESRRLLALIGDIIQLSQLDEAGGALPGEDVDLYALAEEAIAPLQAEAERCGIRLTLSGEHRIVRGIPRVLSEMVFNLCDNAIKYNREGGSVTVTVAGSGHRTVLTVADTGIGIPDEDQPRVFERFYRVDKSRSRALGGTGLGLSIVKHGAQLHHAAVHLESEPGQGTRVTVTF